MRYPLDTIAITQKFGPATAHLGYSFHYGLDLAIPTGTALLAPEDGKPVGRGWGPQAGRYLDFLGTDGVKHRFFHLQANDAEIGKEYREGEVLGRTNNTGLSTGPHLHWQVEINGKPVDPLGWLAGSYGAIPDMNEKEMYEAAVTMARNFRQFGYSQGASHPDADADARAIMDVYRTNGHRFDWALGDYIRNQITGPDWPRYWSKVN